MTALVVGGILAGQGGLLAVAGEKKAAEAPAGSATGDSRDTHERIERIYKQLGIEEAKEEPSGCSCGEPKQQQKQGKQKRRNRVKVPPFVGYLLLGLVLAAMLIPLARALASGYHEVPRDEGEEDDDLDEDDQSRDQRRPWRVDLSACRALAEQGQLPRAFAALHRATLLALQRKGELALDETTTNWAYVRRLTSKPALRRVLAGVTEAAERSVLGKRPPDRRRFDELERSVSEGVRGR